MVNIDSTWQAPDLDEIVSYRVKGGDERSFGKVVNTSQDGLVLLQKVDGTYVTICAGARNLPHDYFEYSIKWLFSDYVASNLWRRTS